MDKDHPPTLSQISHLFLSSVRQKQMGGAPLPRRRPPMKMAEGAAEENESRSAQGIVSPQPAAGREGKAAAGPASVDLTPEELAAVEKPQNSEGETRFPPVSALVGAHLGDKQSDGVRQYARHLVGDGRRIGLIEIDAWEFRLSCFDRPASGCESVAAGAIDVFDARAMADAIEELSWDLDQWLVVVSNARTCEARTLLRQIDHWVILSTCDHAGVIGCYRTLKGLRDQQHPRLTLALLESASAEEADSIYRKLAAVSQQFLNWPLQQGIAVREEAAVSEHRIMSCQATRDKAQMGLAPHWGVVSELLNKAKAHAVQSTPAVEDNSVISSSESTLSAAPALEELTEAPKSVATPAGPVASGPAPGSATSPAQQSPSPNEGHFAAAPENDQATSLRRLAAAVAQNTSPAVGWSGNARRDDMTDVIDLPLEGQESGAAVLAAIMRNEQNQLVECPLTPPMCPCARLAVTRSRRIVLLAVARAGLSDLRSIGLAYRWLLENRTLICMALPQFAIDPDEKPRLRLLVDHADLSADLLQPMLQSSTVTVEAYRKLRWGSRTGLLLEAA